MNMLDPMKIENDKTFYCLTFEYVGSTLNSEGRGLQEDYKGSIFTSASWIISFSSSRLFPFSPHDLPLQFSLQITITNNFLLRKNLISWHVKVSPPFQCQKGCVAFATRAFATPIFVASATPIFVASATPYFRTFATRTAATPKFFFNFSFV